VHDLGSLARFTLAFFQLPALYFPGQLQIWKAQGALTFCAFAAVSNRAQPTSFST
jgi:hypothetical protein